MPKFPLNSGNIVPVRCPIKGRPKVVATKEKYDPLAIPRLSCKRLSNAAVRSHIEDNIESCKPKHSTPSARPVFIVVLQQHIKRKTRFHD